MTRVYEVVIYDGDEIGEGLEQQSGTLWKRFAMSKLNLYRRFIS